MQCQFCFRDTLEKMSIFMFWNPSDIKFKSDNLIGYKSAISQDILIWIWIPEIEYSKKMSLHAFIDNVVDGLSFGNIYLSIPSLHLPQASLWYLWSLLLTLFSPLQFAQSRCCGTFLHPKNGVGGSFLVFRSTYSVLSCRVPVYPTSQCFLSKHFQDF